MQADLKHVIQQLQVERDTLWDELISVKSQAAVMRQALEEVQWLEFGEDEVRCPLCEAYEGSVHTPFCSIGIAISSNAGKTLQDRIQKLEAVADIASEIIADFETTLIKYPNLIKLAKSLSDLDQYELFEPLAAMGGGRND